MEHISRRIPFEYPSRLISSKFDVNNLKAVVEVRSNSSGCCQYDETGRSHAVRLVKYRWQSMRNISEISFSNFFESQPVYKPTVSVVVAGKKYQ